MKTIHPLGQRILKIFLTVVFFVLWFSWIALASAEAEQGASENHPSALPVPGTIASPQAHPVRAMTLPECIHLALDKQPALAAYRASLAAAEAQQRGLEDLSVSRIISPDLPIRRKQAALGVSIAQAGLEQARWETIYAVTRTYFSVVYAKEQTNVVVEALKDLKPLTGIETEENKVTNDKKTAEKESPEGTDRLHQLQIHYQLLKNREAYANRGYELAMAALREAMGIGCDLSFVVADETLPAPQLTLCRQQVVDLALARRGELRQATLFDQVVALEIDAQNSICLPTARTFAAAADIHAKSVPQGTQNGEYRPGAIALEMPTLFAGTRSARVERAHAFHERSGAVVEKTRNLIVLEAEDAWLKWQEAASKIPEIKKQQIGVAKAKQQADEVFRYNKSLYQRDNLTAKELFEVITLRRQAHANYYEVLYEQLLALAALERITAGGLQLALFNPCPVHP